MEEKELLTRLGVRIKQLRKERNLTQFELAFMCGCEKAWLSRIEGGKTNLTIRSLCKISAALQVAVSDLFVF